MGLRAAAPPRSVCERRGGQPARKQRSWLPRAAGPCRHALCPPSEETAAGRLHMETMGSVFFHL